jgi:DNA-binding transcriptional regulator LsrR (DeoR family)
VTQAVLGDAIGMTTVHVNRIVQELKADGLMEISNGQVTIHDEKKLRQEADFFPLCLHQNPAL